MNCQFLLFQSWCIFIIVSSAYGGQLSMSITLQYAYCYELRQFSINKRTPPHQNSFVIDNLCMDLQGLTYHFLSSVQGGTKSLFRAPKPGMTVTLLESNWIGFKLDWLSRPTVNFLCRLQEPTQALHIYHDIYKFVDLNRQDFTIGRIQKLLLDKDTRYPIIDRFELTQQAGLYTEFYKNMQMIFTFKEERPNGDVGNPVLIFLARKFNISDVLVNNNVLIRFGGYSLLNIILTFGDESEASHFCNFLRRYVDPNVAVPIPPLLQEVLEATRL